MRPFRIVVFLAAVCAPTVLWAQPIPIGVEFQVNTYTTNNQWHPAVARDDSGNFVVVWWSVDQSHSFDNIFGQRFDSTGAAEGNEFPVNPNTLWTSSDYSRPAIAMDGAGGFVVVWDAWQQDGANSWGVVSQRFDSAGAALGGEFQINTHTTDSQTLPAVAVDASGNFVVVWESYGQDGSHSGVFGRRFDSAGAALGGEFQVNTYTTGRQGLPAVAVDDSGGFVVAWMSSYQDGSYPGVFGRRFDSAGAAVGNEFQVNTYTTGCQAYPSVAMNGSGDFVVAWMSSYQDGSLYGIFGQRFDATGAVVGGEFQVNAYTSNYQRAPAAAMSDAGDFVVVWQSYDQDGSGWGVFGQSFSRTGAAVGSEFQINTHTTDSQTLPAVVMGPLGDFVATWQSNNQDGSGTGVFGQRFACADSDADGICDSQDVIVTSPQIGASLDCSDPRTTRPTIGWDAGNYDRFRVFLSSDPGFAIGAAQVTSGDTLLSTTSWSPSIKKWKNACRKAEVAAPANPQIFIRVLGVDRDLRKSDPVRKTYSQIVQADVQI